MFLLAAHIYIEGISSTCSRLTGAAISPHTIRTILDKTPLSPQELNIAYEHMVTGMKRQVESGQGIAGLEYFQAMNYLAQRIASSLSVGEVQTIQSSDSLAVMKSQLIKAHNHRHKGSLEQAVHAYQQFCLQTNPNEFEEGASTVNLTQPGQKGIFTKSYTLARYGGSISVHAYLMGIHATDNLDIVEAEPKR